MAAPAVAGDRALIDYIGYSADGRYFAFEEYGVQDGSGFPFSNIFVVDLPNDKWVSGSPYRVRLEGDTDTVGKVRAEARKQAQPTFDTLNISVGAFPIAINGDGEPDAASYGLRFGTPGFGLDGVQDERLLTLETIPLASGQDCSIIDGKTVGFALQLDGEEIHRDGGKLPASRGCAMDYRVYAVVQAPDWLFGEPAQRVAVISVYPFGFEGPDRRFLVVPLPFE
jgi:predicted secreted protein